VALEPGKQAQTNTNSKIRFFRHLKGFFVCNFVHVGTLLFAKTLRNTCGTPMAVRFYLDRPGPDGKASVRMALLRGSQQKWINLPLRVRARDWNRRRARMRASAVGATEINAQLDRLAHRASALLLSDLPLDKVADELRRMLGLKRSTDDLRHLLKEWLEVKAISLRPSSLEVLRRVAQHLEAFLTTHISRQPTTSAVDRSFLERFQAYLVREVGLAHATANRHIAYTKNFLRWLLERGLIQELPPAASLPEGRRDPVFLTPEEIKALETVDISDLPEGYEKARFLLLLACFTGLRVSDLQAGMRPQAWNALYLDRGVWLLEEHKTRTFHHWPLVTPARRLLEARQQAGASTPVPRISPQKANAYIKEIARRAGIDAPVRLSNGEERPKYELLSLHAGRRTFITTVAHQVGTAPLLGLTHADLDTLQRYVGSWDDARRRRIEEAFTGM
jgi:hypothetical protein